MVNDEGQGMTDAGAAEMSGSGQGEGPAGMRSSPGESSRCIFRCGAAG